MPRLLDNEDFKKGYCKCSDCTEFVYVFRADVVAKLPDGYTGELCLKCNLLVCRIDKIGKKDGEK